MHYRAASSRDIDSANLVLTIGQVMNVDWATVLRFSTKSEIAWLGKERVLA